MSNKEKTIKKIVKRDGRVVAFERVKIVRAMMRAAAETGEFDEKEAKRLSEIVVTLLQRMNPTSQASTSTDAEDKTLGGESGRYAPSVEEVQDVVEQVLMAADYYQTAKAYILHRSRRAKVRAAEQAIGVEDDLGLSLNQLRVIERRYLLHDEEGDAIETPKEWLERVAETLASVEKKQERQQWQKRFFEVMSRFEFLPAGRTLNNAGTKQNQLANCFVLPVEDSMEGIFDAVKWTALVHQTGGGTGFNFTNLRPSGDVVTKSAGGFATGPISFMKVFDVATRQVMQGGKKRGANMGILNADHPDILEFIACKTEEGEIANFNISVGASDAFMEAVRDEGEFDLVNPRTGEVVQQVSARTLLDQMASLAWRTGDPGMIFLDAINRNNPLLESQGPIDATNPCGEQPLHPFDACNLGSLNLAAFVKDEEEKIPDRLKKRFLQAVEDDKDGLESVPSLSSKIRRVDWERLEEVTKTAVRMLDNVIDAGTYPLPEITETVEQNRRIGLGVMGWADMLFKLGVSYASDEGVALAEKVMGFVQKASWEASRELAEEKGAFPRWEESAFADGWDPITKSKVKSKKSKKWKVRNVAITTIAPTGTISMAADTSSGVEPVFALSYVKHVVSDEGLTYVNEYFREALQEEIGDEEEYQRVIGKVARHGSVVQVDEVPQKLKEVFVTAHDIPWEWHVKMQAAFQKHTDNAVSKTINMPSTVSADEVREAYLLAWKLGCKGITVYRDKSKETQVLGHGESSQKLKTKSQKKRKEKYVIQSKVKTKTLKQRMAEMVSEEVPKCPECDSRVVIEEGCETCYACGWSKCSI